MTIGSSGDPHVSINSKYGEELDMRTIVANISRKIKIVGSDEDSIGGHL